MGMEMPIAEPFAVAELYCDGFEHHVLNGMMMVTGYRIMPPCHPHGSPERVAVVRLVIKAENVAAAMADAKRALSAPAVLREGDRLGCH